MATMSNSIQELRNRIDSVGKEMQTAKGHRYYDLRKHRNRLIKQLKMCQAYLNDKE